MSPKEEEQRVNEQVLSAAARGDFTPFVNVLDDDVEVFISSRVRAAFLRSKRRGGGRIDDLRAFSSVVISSCYRYDGSSERLRPSLHGPQRRRCPESAVWPRNVGLRQERQGLEDRQRALLSSAERASFSSTPVRTTRLDAISVKVKACLNG
jgi:hypothetical protein